MCIGEVCIHLLYTYNHFDQRIGTPEYKNAIVLCFPNGISEVTPYIAEPDDEMGLRGLVSDFFFASS